MTGGISDAGKQLRNGHFPLCKTIEPAADRHGVRTGAYRKASGHDCRPARSALGFDVEVRKSCSLGCQTIDSRSRCAACDTSSIYADLPVAEVVHQDEDEIGLLRLRVKCSAERG
jgi:hypothetical protein